MFNKYVYVHVLRSVLLILCFNAKFFYRTIIIIFYFVLKTEVSTLVTKFGALEATLISLRRQIGKKCKLADKLLLNFKHTHASTHARARAHTHTHARARARAKTETDTKTETETDSETDTEPCSIIV